MSSLSEFIKARPEKNLSRWAEDFGISRPFLYSLIDETRRPSLTVALRIEKATKGAVPITTWPNLSAVVRAAKRKASA